MEISFWNIIKTSFAVIVCGSLGIAAESFSALPEGAAFVCVILLFAGTTYLNILTSWKKYEPLYQLKTSLPPTLVQQIIDLEDPAQFIGFLDSTINGLTEKSERVERIANENQVWALRLQDELHETKNELKTARNEFNASLQQISDSAKRTVAKFEQEKTNAIRDLADVSEELTALKAKYKPFEDRNFEQMRAMYRSIINSENAKK